MPIENLFSQCICMSDISKKNIPKQNITLCGSELNGMTS
jgi:hypothetical protein